MRSQYTSFADDKRGMLSPKLHIRKVLFRLLKIIKQFPCIQVQALTECNPLLYTHFRQSKGMDLLNFLPSTPLVEICQSPLLCASQRPPSTSLSAATRQTDAGWGQPPAVTGHRPRRPVSWSPANSSAQFTTRWVSKGEKHVSLILS